MKVFLKFALGIVSVCLLLMFLHIVRGEVHIGNHVDHEQCRWAFIGLFALFAVLVMEVALHGDTAPKEVEKQNVHRIR